MKPYCLSQTGQVLHADGSPFAAPEVEATDIAVPHLTPHVERWTLPKGESIGVLIRYSCHCWTSSFSPDHHTGELRIMDGIHPRVGDLVRLEASTELPTLMRTMYQHFIYVTASERNYGVYNMAFTASDGLSYTAFFMVRPRRAGSRVPATVCFWWWKAPITRPSPKRGRGRRLMRFSRMPCMGKP